jgi:serine O-acetyltransferase
MVTDRPISAEMPDWSRENKRLFEWDPAKSLLASIRSWQHYSRGGGTLRTAAAKWCALRHRFWSVVAGVDIPVDTRIEGGLMMPHPNGIVIHANAIIGPNCLLFQQVTIGTLEGSGAPRIGGHVDIGAGARVLGGITVGDHVKIGANAVVLEDVPDYHVATGIPAKIRPQRRGTDLTYGRMLS